MKIALKIHGRGNAWPVPLGAEHPFYDRTDYRELANAAYSLYLGDLDKGGAEVLVDAGHGTIQSLISGRNRIPDCICLTHGHMDHTLSVDWVVQSFWRQQGREVRYPLHSSQDVYDFLIQSYPHLEELIVHGVLLPGQAARNFLSGHPMQKEVELTSFPVYHGPHARGASILRFAMGGKRILFTGDLLTPLLRKQDRELIRGADLLVVDCNNRFAWPRTNHWSFSGSAEESMRRHEVLEAFVDQTAVEDFLAPHRASLPGSDPKLESTHAYLQEVAGEWDTETQPFTILEFCRRYAPKKVALVHYSGAEDRHHHGQEQFNDRQLADWANAEAARAGIGSRFLVPRCGDLLDL